MRTPNVRDMKTHILVELTQDKWAKVDYEDLGLVENTLWRALRCHPPPNSSYYAVRWDNSQTPRCHVFLHKEIGCRKFLPGESVDHVNRNGLDNRRKNLRVCTEFDNAANRRSRRGSSSIFLGVAWYPRNQKWLSRIMKHGKRVHLGYFKSEVEAAKAYDAAALTMHGEFANLNFPKASNG